MQNFHLKVREGYRFEFKKTDEFTEVRNSREDTLYEFNIDWLADSKETVIHWILKEEGGYGQEPDKFLPIIFAEDGRMSSVVLAIDKLHPSSDNQSDIYRARAIMNYCQLESGKEYDLFHEIRKHGKSKYVKVGRMEVK